jgi:hypothetical protein
MPKQIKPDVHEISLAFNPANQKKFLMHKDESHKKLLKGEKGMDKLIAILKKEGQLPKEADFIAVLQKAKLPDETVDLMKGAFRLISTANLEKDVVESLAGFLPMTEPVDVNAIEKSVEEKLRKDIEASIRKDLEKEFKEKGDGSEQAIILLKEQINTMAEDLKTSNKEVEVERDARRLGELRNSVKDMGLPGDVEKTAKTLLMAEKANPELAKDITETLKSTGEAFAASGIFGEVGSSRGGQEMGKAYDALLEKKTALMKENSDLSGTDAWRNVCRENPKLYREYTAEHANKGKGGIH